MAIRLLAFSFGLREHACRPDRHWKASSSRAAARRGCDLAKDPDERKESVGRIADRRAAALDPYVGSARMEREWKKSQWGNAAAVSNRFASDLVSSALTPSEGARLVLEREHDGGDRARYRPRSTRRPRPTAGSATLVDDGAVEVDARRADEPSRC